MGRAIVRKPKVFLFDEPLSNLDAKLRVQMRAEISKLHQRLEATMIYVTHDQIEAMTMGDRIVIMLDGVIQQVAPPLELYQRPANAFVATFIGSPPMNLLKGSLVRRDGVLCFVVPDRDVCLRISSEKCSILEAMVDKPINLGIRPEDLGIATTPDTPSGNTLEADVELVEPMGAETYVYLRAAGQPLTARIHAQIPPVVGERASFYAKAQYFHFFCPNTGKTIG